MSENSTSRLIKSILKGGLDIQIKKTHELNQNFVSCNGFGKLVNSTGMRTNRTDHYYYYIDHYWSNQQKNLWIN